MALNVGELFGSLSWRHDKGGADDFDRRYDEAQARARKKIEAQLGAAVDERVFAKYHESLDRAERRAKQKEAFKVALGADFDPKGFAAFSRAANQAERDAHKARAATKSFGDELHGLNVQMPKLGSVMGLLKWPAIIAGAGMAAQAVSAATAGVTALGSALAPLSGALAAYPALGSAAAQATGTLRLATVGVGAAIGDLNTKLDTSSDAFKKLTPEAQSFAKTVDGMKAPIRDIQRDAQRGLFDGLSKGADAAGKNIDVLARGIPRTARVMGDLAEQAGKLIGSKGFGRDLETQMRRNDTTIRRTGEGALHLGNAVRNVTLAAGPLVEWMTRMGLRFTDVIDKQAKAGRESGKLAHFFDETRIAISRVARIGADLATAFWNIGRAGKPLGDDILVNLVKVADHFRRWTDSARGQNAIARYFREAHDPIFELGKLVHDIGVDFFNLGKGNQLAPMIRTIRVDLLPKFVELVDSTTKAFGPPMLEAIKQVAILFTHLGGTNGPLTMLVTLVGKVAGGINKAIDAVPGLGSAISTLATTASLYAALRIGASLSGLTRIIRLIKDVRKATAVTGAVEVATGAGGAAAGGAAAGGATAAATRTGVTAAIVSKLPIAAIGAAIAVAIAAAIPKTKVHRKFTDFFDFDRIKLDDQIGAIDRFNKALGRLDAIGDKRGADKLGDQFDRLKNAAHGLGSVKDIDKLTDSANELARAGGTLQRNLDKSLNQAGKHFADFRRTGSNNLHGIHVATQENMHFIKRTLSEDSAAGKEALARNFRLARTAVRQAMNDGKISVRDGLAEIQRLMRAELKQYGITGGVASSIIKHGNIGPSGKVSDGQAQGAARGGWIARARHAVGGWIGRRGMVSGDVVPIAPGALAAYGEYDAHGPGGERAIINRHQAPIAEAALAAGGYPGLDALPSGRQLPILERALAPMGGLDRLFRAVTRPHFLAQGGRFQGGGNIGSRHLSKGQLEALWVRAGGDPALANIMAAIALAESGGIPSRNNADRPGDGGRHIAAGLWQILGLPFEGNVYDPLTNARMAVAKYKSQGLGAWEAYTKGTYRAYLGGAAGATSLAGIGGAAAIPAVAAPITAPRTGVPGALGAIVQATLDRAAVGATRHVQSLLSASAPANAPGEAGGPAGTTVFKGITMAKWVAEAMRYAQSKGVESQPTSGYRPGFDPHTASGRSEHQGLQYPHGAVDFGSFTTGLGPKMAVVNATRDFKWPLLAPIGFRDDGHASGTGHALGGFLRRFQSGGFAGLGSRSAFSRVKPIVRPHHTTTSALSGSPLGRQPKGTKNLEKLQVTRIGEYEYWSQKVDDEEKRYGQQEREYNLTDEVLVDSDTGALNVAAINQRAAEIQGLIDIRNRILRYRQRMRAIAGRVVQTFQTIINRLQNSLRFAKKKDRSGIRSQIEQYQGDLTGTWGPNLHELVTSVIPDTRLDLAELAGEKASVLGTQAQPPPAADGGDGGGAAGGATEPAAAPPTPAEIAAQAYQQYQTFLGAQRELLTSFASNAVTQRQAFAPGGVFSGSPDLTGAAFGALRGFGGGANLAGSLGPGATGPTVGVLNVNYMEAPDNAPTLMSQLRFQVEAGGVS
jgi:hypothetical protein